MAFSLFKRREESRENTTNQVEQAGNEKQTLSDVILNNLINGASISKTQALSIPAVSANVDFISNCIASLPVKLYKYKDGKVTEVEGDRRTILLNSDTGDTLDGFQFKKALVSDYLMDKGGYAYIGKFGNESFVVIEYNFEPIRKNYTIFVEKNKYKPYEFIKLLRSTTNGADGEGITKELNEALLTAYQTQLYQLGLVKTGGNKRGFLKSEKRLGTEEMDALKRAWKNLYANNTESVVILNSGIDFKEATNTSVEMQLNESIKSLVDQIDKIFHISNNFYETFKFAIYPIIKAFETALNRDLLLEKEKGKYFFEFDVKELLRASPKERYETYRIAKECGFMTKNEMRQAENMNTISGLDVVDLGLGAVLYDVNNKTYYTPNMDSTTSLETIEEESIIDHDNKSEV